MDLLSVEEYWPCLSLKAHKCQKYLFYLCILWAAIPFVLHQATCPIEKYIFFVLVWKHTSLGYFWFVWIFFFFFRITVCNKRGLFWKLCGHWQKICLVVYCRIFPGIKSRLIGLSFHQSSLFSSLRNKCCICPSSVLWDLPCPPEAHKNNC